MADCPHDQFESQLRVHRVESSTGSAPVYQVWLQVRCAACQAPLTFGALMPSTPGSFLTLASGAGLGEVVLSGVVTPLPLAQPGQGWSRVEPPAPEESRDAEAEDAPTP